MGSIIKHTSKGQLVAYTFTQDALAASQTDVQLGIGDPSPAVTGYELPFQGDVVALAWTTSAAATAGTLTIGVTNAGTENATTTQTVTTATNGTAVFPRGSVHLQAGDSLGAEITTDGSWDAITADLSVVVYVLHELEGI